MCVCVVFFGVFFLFGGGECCSDYTVMGGCLLGSLGAVWVLEDGVVLWLGAISLLCFLNLHSLIKALINLFNVGRCELAYAA